MVVNYEESILTYISSIRKIFGLDSSYESNEHFDEVISSKKPKHVFLLLVDGLGANLIKKKLPKDSFLRKNMLFQTSTVFPPTTTAATTSVRNGKAPNENAWLGWCQYFKEVDDVVVPFRNIGFYNDNKYGKNFAMNAINVKTTVDELKEKGIKARDLFPSFDEDGCDTFAEMCQRLAEYSKTKEYDYIYAYWDKYDSLMHKYGPSSIWCDHYLNHVNECLEELAKQLDNETMLVVIADHGQIDIDEHVEFVTKYEKYFKHNPSLEPRATSFYIKEDMLEEFENEFKKDFQEDFILLTHSQVIDSGLFGDKENHPRFEEFVGDFVAIGKTNKCLRISNTECYSLFKGQHAGMREDELMVPVIVYTK